MAFFAEIKRRKVIAVAGVYAVAAWLLVQIAVAIEAPLGLPGWFDTATIVLLALGFPVALILSWLFDWTPAGVVRDGAERNLRAFSPSSETEARAGTHAEARDRDAEAAGRPLSELLVSGQLPISRMLPLAFRMADALASIHVDGISYGDLRPANVIVMADERIALRKLGPKTSRAPRSAARASAYMSPERARGGTTDVRSDQFSFGAVLYEMSTGRRAFDGAGEADVREAVIDAEPESVSRVNPLVPLPLQWLIERCLAKDPGERFATTADLRNELAAIARTVQQTVAAPTATNHNLPAQHTRLIGRDRDLGEIKQSLLGRRVRLITVVGPGGIGKTRLMIELGRELLEEFPGGVFFVPLDRISDPELVPSEIASALSVQQSSDRPVMAALKHHLREHCVSPTLLLIDNFEQLMEAAPVLSELLSASEQLRLAVTSRSALRISGELEYRLAPLAASAPGTDSVDGRSGLAPAVSLFLDRAASMQAKDVADLAFDDALGIIAEICERLDGLPLAIELAAARTRVLSLPALLERVRDPLRLLSGGQRDSPARQQTLRATLDWSYNLLEEDHRKMFRRLGVFVGGATLEAVEAVCNVVQDIGVDPLKGIESLVDSSLLRPMDGAQAESRFTMLGTMREYALAQLVAAGEEAHTRRAHAAYCLVLADSASSAHTDAEQEVLFEAFDRDLGNLRAALDWLTESRDAEWGLRLASSLGQYWSARALSFEGFERTSRILALEEAQEETELRALALGWAGELALRAGRIEESKRNYLASLSISKKLDVIPGMLRGLTGVAFLIRHTGNLDEANPYLDEALQIARDRCGSPSLIGGILTNVADHALLQGDWARAGNLQEEASRLFVETGDRTALAWSLNHRGDIAKEQADFDTARSLYEEGLATFRELNDRVGIAGCLHDLAGVANATGDYEKSMRLDAEALSLYQALDRKADMPRILDALACSAAASGQSARALTLAGSAAAMRQSLSIYSPEATQIQLEQSLGIARQHMPGPEATQSWLAGWSMQPEQAITFALAG